MSQYGPYSPPPPPPPVQPPPVGPPPTAVVVARYLIYAGIGLSLIRLAAGIFFVESPDFNDDAVNAPPPWVTDVIGAATVLAYLAVWVLGAVFIMRAASWARVVVTVFGALDLVNPPFDLVWNALVGPDGQVPAGLVIVDVVGALIGVAIIVLLWTSDSNRFFQAARIRPGWPPPTPPG